MNILISKAEKAISSQYPEFFETPERKIIFSFLICGTSHVLSESKFKDEILVDRTTNLSRRIISAIGVDKDTALVRKPGQ